MTTHDMISLAFAEDIPDSDITTDNLTTQEKIGYAFLVAKADIKLSGCELFEKSILYMAPDAQIKWFFKDGDTVLKTQKIASIYANLVPVLKGERVALNFLGFLSGIATMTHLYTSASNSTHLKILDTRKTLPLFRDLVKKAVRDGGGHNHRLNLSDGILIKENHIRIAGSIKAAVEQIRSRSQKPIEVEVTTLDEVQQAIDCGAERLLFDNMSNQMIRQAIEMTPDHVATEASGNMTLERIRELSQIDGLDFISVGAITHSAPTADISLLFDL